jgi:polar amino acid transport system substrate-binding protein
VLRNCQTLLSTSGKNLLDLNPAKDGKINTRVIRDLKNRECSNLKNFILEEIFMWLRGKLWILAIILFLFPVTAWPEDAETITLVADEWPPFNSVPGSEEEGYLVDVARAVFVKKGINVSYKLLPWKRAIELTRNGKYNGIIGASRTDAPDFVFPSEELSRNFISFYVRKDSNWKFVNRNDIIKISLGVIAGYDYRKWLLDYISTYQSDPEKIQIMAGDRPLNRNILKLINKRVDAIVDNEAVILNVARSMYVTDQIKLAGYDSEPAFIYIAFSPGNADSQRYADILSEGIIQLRKSGQLELILSRYGLKDWK